MTASLGRRAAAEAVGTALLLAVVVGSAIQAAELSRDPGVQLLANSLASAFGLGVLIVLFGPVSGAHLNPVVTLAAWLSGRRAGTGPALREVAAYIPAQVAGAIVGVAVADAMFGKPLVRFSTHDRSAGHLWLGEAVATGGLILLVFGLDRIGRASLAPVAVAAYIGAGYWFTSSSSFANPALTVGRVFTDTVAGIAPASLVPFVAAQLAGAALGLGAVVVVYGRPGRGAASPPNPAAAPAAAPAPAPSSAAVPSPVSAAPAAASPSVPAPAAASPPVPRPTAGDGVVPRGEAELASS